MNENESPLVVELQTDAWIQMDYNPESIKHYGSQSRKY